MDHDDLGTSSNTAGLSMPSLGSIAAPPPFLSPTGPPSLTPMRTTPHKVDQRPLPPPPGPPTPAFRYVFLFLLTFHPSVLALFAN